MSRHNRRRTRGNHRSSTNTTSQPPFHPDSFSFPTFIPSTFTIPSHPQPPRRRNNDDISAKHWHNRYTAWQVRERRQAEERARLEAEKKRIFGGNEEGEEDRWLGERMMEYFGGLDFIEG